ncbi:hypothetical protein D7223_00445 [Micromonospora endolithica]|uniref:Uncharacterized protein n=1 Tax=Micromonospora endolithica TaxID=230091 RepID=A0A3A9ZQ69_9ACTN|nr:hypothetical protein D7223_00445 [Micromonospora endolithica]
MTASWMCWPSWLSQPLARHSGMATSMMLLAAMSSRWDTGMKVSIGMNRTTSCTRGSVSDRCSGRAGG